VLTSEITYETASSAFAGLGLHRVHVADGADPQQEEMKICGATAAVPLISRL
jgi:hypothetical protein